MGGQRTEAPGRERTGRMARRLAILDPGSAGTQQMLLADRGTGVVFNGRIDNFPEIRSGVQRLRIAMPANRVPRPIGNSSAKAAGGAFHSECDARP